jgi:hypothetical protein
MTALLSLLCWLSAYHYAPVIRDLDSPKFAVRESATERLAKAWPLSHGAVVIEQHRTDSPEVVSRCESVIRRGCQQRFRLTDECWDAVMWDILTHDWEIDGLPFAPEWVGKVFVGNSRAMDAYCRLITRGRKERWVPTNVIFYVEVSAICRAKDNGRLIGMSELRLMHRGLPTVYQWTRVYVVTLSDGTYESATLPWYPVRMAWAIKKPRYQPGDFNAKDYRVGEAKP